MVRPCIAVTVAVQDLDAVEGAASYRLSGVYCINELIQ